MTQLDQLIKEAAKREGIDLIGFAPKERFDALPPEVNPFSIFPEGKTVIMVGKRICRGSLRGIEEGTNFGDYNTFFSAGVDELPISDVKTHMGDTITAGVEEHQVTGAG